MSLPKLVSPKFQIKIPSTGKEVSFRPFLVQEEKVLLIARETGEETAMAVAMQDVLMACLDGSMSQREISQLPFFDVEYIFLNIRAKSVGEVAKFEYRHAGGKNREGKECVTVSQINVNLEEVAVVFNEANKNKFMITDDLGVVMKFPTIGAMTKVLNRHSGNEDLEIVASCIENVYDSEEVYTADSIEETIDFIKHMDTKQFGKINEFFETMPSIKHKVEYTCAGCGQKDAVLFEGISDFF